MNKLPDHLLHVGPKHASAFSHKAAKMGQDAAKYVAQAQVSKHMAKTTKAQSQFAKAASF